MTSFIRIDNALSPPLAVLLQQAGHDAIALQRVEDPAVFDRAAEDDRILVSADTDFGALLATRFNPFDVSCPDRA